VDGGQRTEDVLALQGDEINRSAKKKERKRKRNRKTAKKQNSPPQSRRGPVKKTCEAVFFNQGW
jgi:hypothetical protein